MLHEELTGAIIGVFYHVYHELGYGFLESVYERAMIVGLRKLGLRVERQVRTHVYYEGQVVGVFFADLLVEDRVSVELKARRTLDPSHEAQLLNHLRSTTIELGLLLHFGPKASFRRLILTNERKPAFARRSAPRPSVVPPDVELSSEST
jgi:GxxExxY protein